MYHKLLLDKCEIHFTSTMIIIFALNLNIASYDSFSE